LEEQSRKQAGRALVALRWSQGLALGAVFVVIAGSLLVLWQSAPKTPAQSASVLARQANGTILCGSLVRQHGVPVFRMANGTIVRFDMTTQLIGLVGSCP
jgi:hypothetical protein